MSDLFGFDLDDGLASGQCALCHALDAHLRRWLASFWREGRQDPAARTRFYAGGGFCRSHAQLPDEPAAAKRFGAAIADVYGRLAEQDLAAIDGLLHGRRSRRGPIGADLRRRAACAACVEEAEALPRKAQFFLELVATAAGRRRYASAHALCFPHLLAVLDVAGGDDDEAARFLLDDWRLRLDELRRRLDEYDRARDHRYAAERRAEDEQAWTAIVEHYVGAPPRRPA